MSKEPRRGEGVLHDKGVASVQGQALSGRNYLTGLRLHKTNYDCACERRFGQLIDIYEVWLRS